MKRSVIIITGFMMLITVFYGIWYVYTFSPPRQAAEDYIRALVAGDAETALKFSSGGAAYSASRVKESLVSARVDDVSCSVDALGRGWARVLSTVEISLQDGSVDVGFHSLDVVKTVQGWKVVSFRETGLQISGTDFYIGHVDAEAAKQIFQSYLDALTAGDWPSAAKFLVGPARRGQEMGAAVLGKGAIIAKAENLHVEPVLARGKEMVLKCGYKLEGKDVNVALELYKTVQGWKIARVVQI